MNNLIVLVIVAFCTFYATKHLILSIVAGIVAYILMQRQEGFTDIQIDIASKVVDKFKDIVANAKMPVDYIYFLDSINNPHTELATIDVFNDFYTQTKGGKLTTDYVLSKIKS